MEDSEISYQLEYKNADKDITNKMISYDDLDVKVFILSPKNKLELVAKDFAQNYHHSLKIYQNQMGHFDKSLKIFKSNGTNRVFIQYNNITTVGDKIVLKRNLKPIPVEFKIRSNLNEKLQDSFNIVKSLIFQRIYRNNYAKHCINKGALEGQDSESSSINEDKDTKINLCAVFLETSSSSVSVIISIRTRI